MDINNGNNQNNQNNQYNPNNTNNQNNPNNPNYPNNQYNQYNQNNMYTDPQYNGYQNNASNFPYQAPVGNGGPAPANGLQITSLVCGILAICFSCCCGVPGVILGIVGIICAVNGNKESDNGMGTAGLVCSIVGLILGFLIMIYVVVVYMMTLDEFRNIGSGYDYFYY